MDPGQRRVAAFALYAIAVVLFVFCFGKGFWEWATWNRSEGTLDLGFVKFSTRPAFPNDAKSILAGLILPIALFAGGKMIDSPRKK